MRLHDSNKSAHRKKNISGTTTLDESVSRFLSMVVSEKENATLKNVLFTTMAVCIGCVHFAPNVVFAQDSSTTNSEIEEIVVRGAKRKFAPSDSAAATKIPMDVLDTPQSLTIVSRELMDITGAQSFGDVAALGANTLDADRDVGVFFDVVSRGFRVDFRQGYKINQLPIINEGFLIDFDLVERAELVRGPSSIIYGQSDYGTTINLQLKRPQAETAVGVDLTVGTDSRYKVVTDVTGAISSDERLRGRAIVAYEDTESPQDYIYRKTITVAPSLSYDLTDNTTLELNGFYADRELRESYGFGLTETFQIPQFRKENFFGLDWGVSNEETSFAYASITHQFRNGMQLNASGAYSRATNLWREPFIYGLVPPSGDVELTHFYGDRTVEIYVGNLTFNGTFEAFGQTHEFVIDVYGRENDDTDGGTFDFLGTQNIRNPDATSIDEFPVPDNFTRFNQVEDDLGVGGLLLLHPSDRLTLMAGVRWMKYKNEPQLPNGWFGVTESFSDDDVIPRIGATYSLGNSLNLFASYSEGVLFRQAIASTGGTLGPEKGKQWEIGVKARVLDDNLTMSLAYFTIDRENVAAPDPNFPLQPFQIGIDGQTHEGIEFEAMGEPVPGWNIFASYGYLDVEVTDAPDPATIGQRRSNTPRNQAKVYSTYEVLDGPLQGLSFGGGIHWVGDREVDNYGTFQLPSYTRVDLRAAYDRFENVTFSINAINITDEDILSSFDDSPEGGIFYQEYPSVYGKISFRF